MYRVPFCSRLEGEVGEGNAGTKGLHLLHVGMVEEPGREDDAGFC